MELSFNKFGGLENDHLFLCSPNGKELFVMNATNRRVTLRFNDLSVLEFDIPAVTNELCYEYVQTNRLVHIEKIGWFRIAKVTESSDSESELKTVYAESLQSVFKRRGVSCQERVFSVYNPADPRDERVDINDEAAVPSVVGQMYQQLGIKQTIMATDIPVRTPFKTWTITYVSRELYCDVDGAVFRTVAQSDTNGYDWMVNNVENAFNVIFCFDFENRAIQIKTVDEIVERANLCLSFANFMKNIDIDEDAENITTVLSCSGDGVDISLVNPTGTKYITDFSYYMDKVNHRWMSDELIEALEEWYELFESQKEIYSSFVRALYSTYKSQERINTSLKEISLEIQDLKNGRDEYIKDESGGGVESPTKLLLTGEVVGNDQKSADPSSDFSFNAFGAHSYVYASTTQPNYDIESDSWVFDADTLVWDTAEGHMRNGRLYFNDGGLASYCVLNQKAVVDETGNSVYECSGYTRYISYGQAYRWIHLKEIVVAKLNEELSKNQALEGGIKADMLRIANSLDFKNFFTDDSLMDELLCYWFESSFEDSSIAAQDMSTGSDLIDLAGELMSVGVSELSKICQPRYSFSIGSQHFLLSPEFEDQIKAVDLGKIITIEKEDGRWLYPVLLEIQFSLDDREDVTMTYGNRLRLDDWGYTYADLITSASSTANRVDANWSRITSYGRDKDNIASSIKNPLDSTARAAFANAQNQEFVTDDTGILGRKKKDGASATDDEPVFEGEQIRMINNLLLFTDDGWKSTRAAIGKVTNPDGTQSYGVIAEVLVGDLMVGKDLRIVNDGRSVTIDGEGITILKDGMPVFYADDEGSLHLVGSITTSNIDVSGGKIVIPGEESGVSRSAVVTNGGIYLTNNKTGEIDGETDRAIFIGSSGIDYLVGYGGYHSANSVAAVARSSSGIQYNLAGGSIIVSPTQRRLVGEWQIETATSSTAVVSDRNRKDNIADMPDIYSDLHKTLRPVVYTYKDGESGRIHTGFIAQDIEDSLRELGLTTQEFAAVCYEINEDGEKVNYGVRYDEIVALNTKEIQRLNNEIKVLQEQLSALTGGASSVDENITKEE